jgi:ADP-heptose:LPS heptosyltransferase
MLPRPTSLRAQAKTLQRELKFFTGPKPPSNATRRRIWYYSEGIKKCGSILEAMNASFGVQVEQPDFSLPIRPEWYESLRKVMAQWRPEGKPILVYRPLVLRKEWDGSLRNPDTDAYTKIFQHIRDRFFVVSIADLEPQLEWIVGDEQEADIHLHRGELDFQTMAALFSEAAMVLSPAGFGPVLAQAVGTPIVAVYGGRESYKTTDRAGAHLAPTLGIDPDKPCDCHQHRHSCSQHKRITIEPALERLDNFVRQHVTKDTDIRDDIRRYSRKEKAAGAVVQSPLAEQPAAV